MLSKGDDFAQTGIERVPRERPAGRRGRSYIAQVRSEDGKRSDRASWPVWWFALGEEPSDDLSATTTAEQRLAMMWPLAVDAWTLAGLPIPDYPRSAAPVRCARPGGAVNEDFRDVLRELLGAGVRLRGRRCWPSVHRSEATACTRTT